MVLTDGFSYFLVVNMGEEKITRGSTITGFSLTTNTQITAEHKIK